MRKKNNRESKFIKEFIKKNNVEHTHGGRWKMVSKKDRDAQFLHNEAGKNEWPIEKQQ